ncbi:hypothetical protein RAS1_20650 [Phycisphaerae bacterium RAS1]|nr:hypothetical protein RAS1_20650 [Phycisphaerae bacterium RAS1]
MNTSISQIKNFDAIKSDLLLIVGGNFMPDCIGPDKHAEVCGRVQAAPDDYLQVFDSVFLAERYDATQVSSLYLPSFLEMVKNREPRHVRWSADALRTRYDAALISYDAARDKQKFMELLPDEPQRLVERVRVKRIELDAIVKSLPAGA